MDNELRIRPLNPGPDDAVWLEIENRINAEFPDTVPKTLDQLVAERQSPSYDPQGRFIAELGGRPMGTVESAVDPEDPERIGFVYIHVLPEFRRQHIGTALARAALADLRRREITRVRSDTREENTIGAAFVLAQGFTVCRYWSTMRRSLADLPSGRGENTEVEIVRLGTGDDDVRLMTDLVNETFAGSWEYYPTSFALSRHWTDECAREGMTQEWFVARKGSEPAGIIGLSVDPRKIAHLNKKRGFLFSLGVRPPLRGQGIAKALLIRALRGLQAHGMEEAELHVDDANPLKAIQIYLGLGFKVVRRVLSYELTLKPAADSDRAQACCPRPGASPAGRRAEATEAPRPSPSASRR